MRITHDKTGRAPKIIVEGMHEESSLYHLGKDEQGKLYLIEYHEPTQSFSLHTSTEKSDELKSVGIMQRVSPAVVGSHMIHFKDNSLEGKIFFQDMGDRARVGVCTENGIVIEAKELKTVRPYRPRYQAFPDTRYTT